MTDAGGRSAGPGGSRIGRDEGAALAAALAAAGLHPRALAAWAGTDHLPAVRLRVPTLARREVVPAAAGLALLVAGVELAIDRAARLPLDALLDTGLIERDAATVRARVAILPWRRALLVCDRADAPAERAQVCWPDDSSFHLAGAPPPGRRATWLDLACGSACAQLARPELAARLHARDVNPRAVAYARLGAALSGVPDLDVREADIGDADPGGAPAELVTCNAPLPDDPSAALWRRADRGFFARLFDTLPARLAAAPGALAVVHAAGAALPADLPGERVIVAYTPPGERELAVLWWRPHAPARVVVARRALTAARPHLTAGDRDDALAGALC